MNRGMADLTAPGPPRDLPHRRTASLRVQSIEADKEIVTGPGGDGSRLIAPTLDQPPTIPIMSEFVAPSTQPLDRISMSAYSPQPRVM